MRWVPNLLSVFRLGVAIAYPFIPEHWWMPAIVLAALSEWGDGQIARRFSAITRLGQLLDPVADKFLFGLVLLTLIKSGILNWWELGILAIRDHTILSGVAWIFYRRDPSAMAQFAPKRSGKITTACQYGYIFSLLYFRASLTPFFLLTAAVGAWSALDYILWFIRTRTQDDGLKRDNA